MDSEIEQDQHPDYLSSMIQLQERAMTTIQTQDLQEITIILQKGKSLYKKALQAFGEGDLELGIMAMCLCMVKACYLMVKAVYSKLEEKFEQAHAEYNDSLVECEAGKKIIIDIQGRAEGEWRTALAVYHFLFNFLQYSSEAEALELSHEIKIAGGGFSDYAAILQEAANRYRKINEVELDYDNDNPVIPALIKMLNRLADIKEAKAGRVLKSAGVLKHLPAKSRKIFLIHGHGEAFLLELQDLLEKKLGLTCVILKHESNLGDSVMEKFEKHAADCGYAFAILSADDMIEKDGTKYFQSRPNVLFELGWFYGRYGRKNVCLLKQNGVVMPSDMGGIISLEFDKKIAEVYLDMETELTSAGIIS